MAKKEKRLVFLVMGSIFFDAILLIGIVNSFLLESSNNMSTVWSTIFILVITGFIISIILKTFWMIKILNALKLGYKDLIQTLGPSVTLIDKKSELFPHNSLSYVAVLVENGHINQPVYLKKCDDCWGVFSRYDCYSGEDYFISKKYLLLIDKFFRNHYLFEIR